MPFRLSDTRPPGRESVRSVSPPSAGATQSHKNTPRAPNCILQIGDAPWTVARAYTGESEGHGGKNTPRACALQRRPQTPISQNRFDPAAELSSTLPNFVPSRLPAHIYGVDIRSGGKLVSLIRFDFVDASWMGPGLPEGGSNRRREPTVLADPVANDRLRLDIS